MTLKRVTGNVCVWGGRGYQGWYCETGTGKGEREECVSWGKVVEWKERHEEKIRE